MSSKIGDLLVKESLISQQQLKEALEHQRVNGGRLGNCLIKLGFVTDDEITAILSRQYGVPSINLSFFDVDPSVVKLIPVETAQKYQILPLSPRSNAFAPRTHRGKSRHRMMAPRDLRTTYTF